ncbi:Trm112 family protein [Bermanella sp. R86510]|uniref:Trm112 family protein n=1 Tax=unclassified Bermanella TaxID=2627862 RepID=UPI0037CC33AC
MDKKLIALMVCPLCKGSLKFDKEQHELVCKFDGLAYPIKDGIPDMLIESARKLSVDEKLAKS